MSNESLFYFYIIENYEYTEIVYSNKNKKLNLKIGDTLFNILNNQKIIIHILNEYIEKFLDLNIQILNYDSCANLLNQLTIDLEHEHIDSFLSNLIYHDLIIICKRNIELLDNMQKNLLEEKKNLILYKNLIKNRNEKDINEYINKNKYNYDSEKAYNDLLSSSIETKITEIKQEIKFCNNNIAYYKSELDTATIIAKSNINIRLYIDILKRKLDIFEKFFSKKYMSQKKDIKNIFKKVLSSEIKIPNCILNYGVLHDNIFKKFDIKQINKKNIDLFLEYKPYIAYNITSIEDLFNIYIKYFIDNNTTILICKNCGKYFIPQGKQVYCNNTYHNNKSCRQLSGDMKKNNDKIYVLYRNNYKTQFNKMNRNKNNIPNIKEKFNNWNTIAKEKMLECKKNIISYEDLQMWFKTNQNWHR